MSSNEDKTSRNLTIFAVIGIILFTVFGISKCAESSQSSYKTYSPSHPGQEEEKAPAKVLTREERCKNDLLQSVYKNQSKQVMTSTLKEKGYSIEEINEAINNVKPNFPYAAQVRCELLVKNKDLGKKEAYNSLVYDYGFTKKEAEYAVSNAKVQWNEDAKTVANYIIEQELSSRVTIAMKLESDYGFSNEEAIKAMSDLNINWKKVCLFKAVDLIREGIDFDNLYDELKIIEAFSKEEVSYAIDNLDHALSIYKKAMDRAYDKNESYNNVKKYLDRFTSADFDEINYAVSRINFSDVALKTAKKMNQKGKTRSKITEYLEDKEFTKEEIDFALDNL